MTACQIFRAHLALAALVAVTACASPGKFVWVDDYVDPARGEAEKPYAIAPGDVLQVRVFNQDQLATRAKVREDGKFSMPLVNDVPAAGLTPVELASAIQGRLKDYLKAPLVTVSVEETRPATVYVTGEVARPGVYPLDPNGGVLQALVHAGGLLPDASHDRIFVLREGNPAARIRFTYDGLTHLVGRAATFRLRAGDTVVVE